MSAAAKVYFKQNASGLVTAEVKVVSVLVSGRAFAFAFSLLFLVAAICYCIVEWLAFKLIRKTRRCVHLFVLHALAQSGLMSRCPDLLSPYSHLERTNCMLNRTSLLIQLSHTCQEE